MDNTHKAFSRVPGTEQEGQCLFFFPLENNKLLPLRMLFTSKIDQEWEFLVNQILVLLKLLYICLYNLLLLENKLSFDIS